MVYETLPKIETHSNLFFTYKHSTESLGIAEFSKNDFNYRSFDYLPKTVENFFTTGMHLPNYLDIMDNDPTKWRANIENYVKLVWLAREYIQADYIFKNPIGAIYNPPKQIWEIHPGGSRQIVYKLFGPDTILALAFNTKGKSCQFKKTFSSEEELNEYFPNTGIFLVVCAEWGSLIPHVHFDQGRLTNSVRKESKRIIDFWQTTNVQGNVPDWVLKNNNKNKSKTLKLNLKNPDDFENILKGLVLLPNYDYYNDHGVKITNVGA